MKMPSNPNNANSTGKNTGAVCCEKVNIIISFISIIL